VPSNPFPSGALSARLRRTRVLIVGCGDVGQRVAALLAPRVRVIALSSSAQGQAQLRARGICTLAGNLDQPATLARLAGIAHRVLHLAPPQGRGDADHRTHALLRALRQRSAPIQLVYGSTSGVYGDCDGAWVHETRPVRPATARAQRRVDAERQIRVWGRQRGTRASILRIPGIYAPDRSGGTPRARLQEGLAVLRDQDDVYTSHIHAQDLARACVAALWRGKAQRVYHVNDDTVLKMGDYMDLAADLYKLPRPPRISREAAQANVPVERMRFMSESRRLRNRRMKQELRLSLRYPTVRQGLL